MFLFICLVIGIIALAAVLGDRITKGKNIVIVTALLVIAYAVFVAWILT
jgi:uncharacterized membrane protein YccC